MWRRGRIDADLVKLSAQSMSSTDSPSSPAVSWVDDALRIVSTRQCFTREEALGILHGVESIAHDLPAGARVVEIVNGVGCAARGQSTLSRAEVLNPLLDIRLALSS